MYFNVFDQIYYRDKFMKFEKAALVGHLRPPDVTLQDPDCSSFSNINNWAPKVELEQTLSDLLNYHRGRV